MSLVRRAFATGLVAAAVLASASEAGARSAYRNRRWGFCLSYPAGWTSNDGPDGNVFRLSPRKSLPGSIQPVLMAAGYRDLRGHSERRTAEQPEPRGPQETLDEAINSLKDQMVRKLSVSSHWVRMWGLNALLSDLSYEQEGLRWRSHQIRAMRPDKTVLELIVSAPEQQFAPAKRAFDAVVRSFDPQCGTAEENRRQSPSARQTR